MTNTPMTHLLRVTSELCSVDTHSELSTAVLKDEGETLSLGSWVGFSVVHCRLALQVFVCST
jgi:hypothetical protein